MNKPTDYPLDPKPSDSTADTSVSDTTFAILRDRVSEDKPVTDEMINIARTKMDSAHVTVSASESVATPLKSKFSSIRDRFKTN